MASERRLTFVAAAFAMATTVYARGQLLTGSTGHTAEPVNKLPQALIDAQAVCVQYLGICNTRTSQYNNSIYPTDRDTMCMIRCTGILMNFWEDSHGLLLDGVAALFPDTCNSTQYRQHVLSCTERKLATCLPDDACAKAFNAFRCVLESRKALLHSHIQRGSFTGTEFIQSIISCSKILRIPPSHVKLYLQGSFPNDAQTRCLVRCVGIRTGTYDDCQGPNLERLYTQFAGGVSEAEFKLRAQLCMSANQPLTECHDKCTPAYRKLYLCFKESFSTFARTNANYLAQLDN